MGTQSELELPPPPPGHRSGGTYSHEHDFERLNTQMGLVWRVVCDGGWYRLYEISLATNQPEASVSARLRDLRKKRFGGYLVDCERVHPDSAICRYRVRIRDRRKK